MVAFLVDLVHCFLERDDISDFKSDIRFLSKIETDHTSLISNNTLKETFKLAWVNFGSLFDNFKLDDLAKY